MNELVHIRRCPTCRKPTKGVPRPRTVLATCVQCNTTVALRTAQEVSEGMEMDRRAAREFGGAL